MSYDLFIFPDRHGETIVLIQDLALDWQHFRNSWSPVCKIDVMARTNDSIWKDAPASTIWLAIATCLAVQYGEHTIVTHVRTAANIYYYYMLLAQARVCHVRTCAQYSLVEANARWRLEMSCHWRRGFQSLNTPERTRKRVHVRLLKCSSVGGRRSRVFWRTEKLFWVSMKPMHQPPESDIVVHHSRMSRLVAEKKGYC